MRYHCLHVLRQRTPVPLDAAGVQTAGQGDPLLAAAESEAREEVRRAIETLPKSLKSVVRLRYDTELSQQEIATRLRLTLPAVNMRLHAARTHLRKRLRAMTEVTLPQQVSGRVEQSVGPVVTLQFDAKSMPPIFGHLSAGADDLVVIQQLNAGRVKAVATREDAIWTPGQQVPATGRHFEGTLDNRTVQRALDTLPGPAPGPARLASGIKAIEIFAPLSQGGKTGIFAEWGVGALVLLPELLRNLDGHGNRQSFCVFVPPPADAQQWREVTGEMAVGTPDLGVLYLPVADPIEAGFVRDVQGLDSTLVLSRRLSEQAIWPSLDPLRCRSRQLSAVPKSREHEALAENLRQLLREYYRLQFSVDETEWHVLSPKQKHDVHIARCALKYLSQPLFVAEPYTGRPGEFVTADQAAQGFAGILAGRHAGKSPDAFYMVGAAPK